MEKNGLKYKHYILNQQQLNNIFCSLKVKYSVLTTTEASKPKKWYLDQTHDTVDEKP